jgi:hypothetical protein
MALDIRPIIQMLILDTDFSVGVLEIQGREISFAQTTCDV